MGLITKILGSISDRTYNSPGVNRIALVDRRKVTLTGLNTVTAIALETGTEFQEIFLEKDSGEFRQAFTKSGSARYISQTLVFKVISDDLDTIDDIILSKELVALIRFNDGRWVIAGTTSGLSTEGSGNYEDVNIAEDAAKTFTLFAKNNGNAPIVDMTESAINALINSEAPVI